MRLSALLSVLALTASAGWVAAGTVAVTPANMNGWTFASFDGGFNLVTSGPYAGTAQMVTGPAGQPLGTGSAHLATNSGQGDGGEIIATDNFDGTRLDALTSLSYSTYMTANNGQQFPYIGLAISTDGNPIAADGSNLDFIDFEPPFQSPPDNNSSLPDQGATAPNEWQSWNALVGGWDGPWGAGSNVEPLSSYLALHPDAMIADPSGIYPGFGGINLQVGFGDSADNFDGNVDAFSLGTGSGTTTYNFDPNSVPLPTSAWSGMALLAGLGLMGGLNRRRSQVV